MKKQLLRAADAKPVSFLTTALLLFTCLAGVRRYLYDHIYTAFDLGSLGAFGAKLSVSALLAALLVVGLVAGGGIAFAVRRRVTPGLPVVLYTLSALFAIVFLFFTPYNLQLLLPSQVQQNIAMINCIAVLVFCAVDTALYSLSLLVHWQLLGRFGGRAGAVWPAALSGLAFAGAMAVLFCHAPFAVCTAVFAGVLLFVNIADAARGAKPPAPVQPPPVRRRALCAAVPVVLAAVSVLAGALWTEQAIVF